MARKLVYIIVLLILTLLSWFASLTYEYIYVMQIFYTFLAVSIVYLVLKVIFETAVEKGIKDSKSRYSFRKAISIIYIVVLLFIIIRIWIEDPQTLLVAYGLIGAGIAIALQDLFKSLVGGILLFIGTNYKVGDRIQIGENYGDVIDINILSTTLLELKEWVKGEQPTGRLTTIPNNRVLYKTINNYTQDNSFLWDEISVPIKYGSDWKKAIMYMKETADENIKDIEEQAQSELSRLSKKYYISSKSMKPEVYITFNENWVVLNLRYVTDARKRRDIESKLKGLILEKFEKDEEIEIASVSLEITSFPDIKEK